jgi:hypothetical protein
MSDTGSGLPAAGWYPDPAGSPRTRWWDGARWTESFSAPATTPPAETPSTPWSVESTAVASAAPSSSAPYAGFAATTPYASAAPYSGAPESLAAPAGTRPYTPWIWALALLPLVNTVSTMLRWSSIDSTIDAATESALSPGAAPPAALDLASYAISFLVFAAAMLFVVFDWRALDKAGVPRPFHWAWGFFMIIGAPVYMIGRSIVVRRRTGSGLAPMFVNLALIALNFALAMVIAVMTFSRVMDTVAYS